MSLNPVTLLPAFFPLADKGKPVASGYIYVGEPDTDPEVAVNQKTLTVLQEDGTEVVVDQPLRTSAGGLPIYSGSVVTMLVDGDYSLKVLDSALMQVIYVPSNPYFSLGSCAEENYTISTDDPSGGSDGDVWYKVSE